MVSVVSPGEETCDRLLVWLALLAPLLLLALGKWQNSLVTWYVPMSGGTASYFGDGFGQDVQALPGLDQANGVTLFFMADKSCPCTEAALDILRAAMAESSHRDLHLVVVSMDDSVAGAPAWRRIWRQIPATPTLLVVEGRRLVYGGPVNSGNLCTKSVLRVLGLSVLQSESRKPVINWLEKGCYCPTGHVDVPRNAEAPRIAS